MSDRLNNVTMVEEGMSGLQFMKTRIRSSSLHVDEDPFYVADLSDVVDKHRRFLQELPRVKPFYAVKCNSSKEILQTLAVLGTGFDCASPVEIDMILRMGVPAVDIVYANTCKQPSHIRHAAKHAVHKMTFDCESELVKVAKNHPTAQMILRISTNDTGSISSLSTKFGAPLEKCEHLLRVAKSLNILVIGVSFHIGSGSSNPQAFCQSIGDARCVFDLGKKLGHKMRLLDIGGGFPGDPDFQPQFEEFTAVITESLDRYFPSEEGIEIIAEPGRYYVSSAFTAALNILSKKEDCVTGPDGKQRRQLFYYLNDGLFGSLRVFKLCKFERRVQSIVAKNCFSSEKCFPSKLWGPCCTDHDEIMEDVDLPELEMGDWIIFSNMGAYSISMASTFNGFQPPHVYYIMSKEKCKIFEQLWHELGN